MYQSRSLRPRSFCTATGMRHPLDKSNGGSRDEIEHVRAVTPDELPPRVIITKRMQKVRGVNTVVRYN